LYKCVIFYYKNSMVFFVDIIDVYFELKINQICGTLKNSIPEL